MPREENPSITTNFSLKMVQKRQFLKYSTFLKTLTGKIRGNIKNFSRIRTQQKDMEDTLKKS